MKNKNIQDWIKPPELGDLVEVGHDHATGKPFIGVITEINHRVGEEAMTGRVLVNEKLTWVDLYKLKPVKRKTRGIKDENEQREIS